MTKRRFRTAFLLGAGLGVRLRPLTSRCPKPLLPVGGRPIITYGMDHLMEAGVDRFIVNTHHCPWVYGEVFPDKSWRGVPIEFCHEPVLLDTGGGVKNIEDLLKDDEAIVCYNGDILTDLPLKGLIEAHDRERPEATLALRSTGPLLNVCLGPSGDICDLRTRLGNPGVGRFLFTGVYVMETALLAYTEKGAAESIIDVFLRRIVEKPGSIRGAVIDDGDWYDIGSPEVYDQLRERRFPRPQGDI